MKKYLVTLLIIITSLCILACGGDSKKSSTSSSQKTEVQKSELKSQDLKKLIPLAKMFTMSEQELREVEKIFSALGINVDNIEEWQRADYEVASVSGPHGLTRAIRVDLAPGKGQSFDFILSKKSRYLYLFFDLKNLFLAEYGQKSDAEVLFYNGKIYNKISDYLIDDSVRDKALHKATELAKKYYNKKGITDLKLSEYNLRVRSYAKGLHGPSGKEEEKLFEERLDLDDAKKNDLKGYSKYISGYAAFKGKEKYYGGENDVEVSIQYLHFDLEGNFVDPDLFRDATYFKDRSGIYNIPGNGGFKSTNPPAQAKETNDTKNISNTSVTPISTNAIVSAKHSSADNEDGYNHSAPLTTDGDTKTCWAEGVPGLGIGENLTYYFDGNYKVNGLNIWTGHQKSEDLFYKNARPTAIRIIGSDGSNVIYPLNDAMGMQRVTFNNPITVNNIKLVIEKVAPGNKYEDTCIAEVNFF